MTFDEFIKTHNLSNLSPKDIWNAALSYSTGWEIIAKDQIDNLGKTFIDPFGNSVIFVGLVLGVDDYYYGFETKDKRFILLSACKKLDEYGYKLYEND